MADNVIRLVPASIGEGHALEAKQVLESALESDWDEIIIIGRRGDELDLRSTHGLAETILLIERAKANIL